MDWYLAAPFIHSRTDLWLARFVPPLQDALRFFPVPAPYHHDRSRKATGLAQWKDYLLHGSAVWNEARRATRPAGIVTCFPQLALTTSLRKRFAGADTPIVAWNFNVGVLPGGLKRRIARNSLRAVDRFVVHSRAEIRAYADWLALPTERFEFVPLQRAIRNIEIGEDEAEPFVLSMGSAHRDYRLLFAALGELGLPAVVVAGPHAVEGLAVPANVSVRSGLSADQCHALVQRARVSVIPVANEHTASGQVTLLDAMMFGRPVIITECPASTDYVTDGHDAVLVRRGDEGQMKRALGTLWEDSARRAALGQAARATAIERFSDEAIGRKMGDILTSVARHRRRLE